LYHFVLGSKESSSQGRISGLTKLVSDNAAASMSPLSHEIRVNDFAFVTAEDIAKNQDKMVCAFSFWNFGALIDIKPTPKSLYIHSLSEPFDDEGKFDKKRVNAWLERFDLNRFQSHCSGHSKGKYLLDIVKTIDAKMLYPIHTEHPDAYTKVTDKITIVKEGIKYNL